MLVEWSYDERFRKRPSPDRTACTGDDRLHGAAGDLRSRSGQRGVRARPVREPEERSGPERGGDRPVRHASRCGPRSRRRDDGFGRHQSDLRFVWGGDTAGQGWGINPGFGGMKIYEAMRQRSPHFFIHSGDTIYADGPIAETATSENGSLDQPGHARGQQGRRDARRVPRPVSLQPARRERAALQRRGAADLAVGRPRGHQQLVRLEGPLGRPALHREERAAAGRPRRRAPFSNTRPIRPFTVRESERVYRRFSYGPLLELFVLDMRSYRGPNTANLQPTPSRRPCSSAASSWTG